MLQRPISLSATQMAIGPNAGIILLNNSENEMIKAIGYAAQNSIGRLKPFEFERDEAGADEVQIDVMYCGVCHSDIHQVKNEWSNTVYPCVPGHEVVGKIVRVGESVSRHKPGDLVGVGCMIGSCNQCDPCIAAEENYCQGPNGWLATCNGPIKPAKQAKNGRNDYGRDNTFGGYSNSLVVDQHFVLKIPTKLKPELAAPILCAGATTYSSLAHWKVKAGDNIGIIGFGGLGHMAAKLAKAMGAHVTVLTSTWEKLEEATRVGFNGIMEDDEKSLQSIESTFDFILDTVPKKHDLNPFILLLKRDRTICVIGALEPLTEVNNQSLACQRKHIAGSLIGSIKETQEVLEFCAEHGISPDIELVDIQEINNVHKRVVDGDARFRYVIDMASLKKEFDGITTGKSVAA
jgi:uncharacterized zinc-type alcohol dehydrogenase-like protein